MKSKFAKRLLWIALTLFLLIAGLALPLPGPIDGCYTLSDITTEGHNFLHFSGGNVTWVLEYGTNRPFGTYSYRENVGWIWLDTKTKREVIVKPHLLWVEFVPT